MWPLTLVLLIASLSSCAGAGSFGYLAVNNEEVRTEINTPENQPFRSFGFYNFTDGEQAKFTCHKTIKIAVLTQLSLNKNDNSIIATGYEPSNNIEMYVKLTADYEASYIDCSFKKYDGDISVTRMFLTLRDKTSADLGFRVNDLTLTSIHNQSDQNELSYIYTYFDGENVTVRSLKDELKYGEMDCKGEHLPNDLSNLGNTWKNDGLSFSTIMNEKQNVTLIKCFVKLKQSSSSITNRYISMALVPNDFNYSPYIKGLSMANVLLKFNSTSSNHIYYERDDNKELHLRCYWKTSGAIWEYNSDVEIFDEVKPTASNNFELSGTFKMKPGKSNVVINCSVILLSPEGKQKKKMTRVELLRKKRVTDFIEENFTKANTGTTMDTSNTGSIFGVDNGKPPEDSSSNSIYLIGVPVGLVLVTVAVLTIIGITRKRKWQIQHPRAIDNVYESLPEHNEAPMSVPSQWIEAQYSAPADTVRNEYAQPYVPRTTEELYSKPLPKHQRQGTPQPNYEERDRVAPTYAQVLPKSIQNEQKYVQVLPKTVNDSLYAALLHKSNRHENSNTEIKQETPYAEVEREPPYATIKQRVKPYTEGTGENQYAEPDCSTPTEKYANVFNSSMYVNSNTQEDNTESPYCEIDVKNNYY